MGQSPVHQKTRLSNGLRVVTEHIPGVRSASLGIWVTVGSRHETASVNGISHFIEHMAFKGTGTRTAFDIARTVEQGGGYINAFTGRELTCFHVHVLDERLPETLAILADILQDSRFDPGEMEKEKHVILDEIRDHEDMPDDVAHERFVKALFGSHSLARPILGSPANVRAFSRQRVLRFVNTHYTANRMVVAAAGHVSHARLVRQVEDLLRPARAGHIHPQRPLGREKSRLERHRRPIQQAHLVLGSRGLAYNDRHRFVLSVLNTVLGGGMSSRLFQNIREKHGVAYAIYSFADTYRDTGIWGVYLATDPDRVDRAREMVEAELRQISETLLTREELESVKTQIKGSIMLSLESVSNRMMRLGRMEVYLRRFHSLESVCRQIEAVTAPQVRSLAERLLCGGHRVTVIVEPEPGGKSRKRLS